jgi:hypothetical protein
MDPTATARPTETPKANTALVNSPTGLWLRETPAGRELELIPDGTTLMLINEWKRLDDLEWQKVTTPAGNEGWVAVDFILNSNP